MTTLSDRFFGNLLGIEFKEDAVVVTYLKSSMSGLQLLSSSSFPLRDNDSVSDEIKEYIGQQGINISSVFVSIPDKWSVTKFTEVPSLKGKGKGALANLMRFEIERHIPFQIEDVAYDFLLTDEKDMTYSIVFAVVQKEKIEFIKDFLDKIALQPHTITLSSFAVLNTIELSEVTVGGWQDIIGIVRKSDSLGKPGETNISLYTDKVNASLSIIRDGVCTQLKSFIIDPSGSLDDFYEDIAGYLAYMRSEHSIDHFNKLILNGEVSSIAESMDQLKEKLRIKVVTVDQISEFKGNIRGVNINGLAASIGACFAGLGVGTYRMNLLPHKIEYEIKKVAPLATKVFLVLIVLMLAGIFAVEAVKQKNLLTELDDIIETNSPEVKVIEKLSAETKLLETRLDFLQKMNESEFTIEMLAELTAIFPKDSWITNLDYKGLDLKSKKQTGGELMVSGYAASSSALISIMEDSPFFEKVAFVGTIKKTKDREKFKLSAQVVRPARENDNDNSEEVK
ncbi:MAG: PilN domain-containing protein [Nitrospirota bacterium]